jgi:hypothetical protein
MLLNQCGMYVNFNSMDILYKNVSVRFNHLFLNPKPKS